MTSRTTAPAGPGSAGSSPTRAELVADTALGLLAERGMRGLTHRAVDEAAGLPQGSTSNHARTRAALLEAALRRLAVREAALLTPQEMPEPGAGAAGLAELLAVALHRHLAGHPELTLARYELALEATRRPELRALYDRIGISAFREPLAALLRGAGSAEPERHALSVVAWCDGMMFSCSAGAHHTRVPTLEELRAGARELLRGILGG
ncbi:TetR family transcriptional regulator [Streptomyces armeniacus]|uniref:TetR family transcriptional regulator n=1 Tax=Streptomyces armeniacus TaxID=83291 RepID=A0A345XS40_9ACTN|nr:TetR/AcrR family transcriptional regulator [Streptomyces armeniacus]AXK34456.1 TetR family transcriptional regulator [Streptomyces armeniacus]